MKVIESDRVAYFDVDSTLVLWDADVYTPNIAVVNELKAHYKRGHAIVVWSAGGWAWAQRVVKELGLEEMVDLVIAKPAWIWDDLPAKRFIPENIRYWKK